MSELIVLGRLRLLIEELRASSRDWSAESTRATDLDAAKAVAYAAAYDYIADRLDPIANQLADAVLPQPAPADDVEHLAAVHQLRPAPTVEELAAIEEEPPALNCWACDDLAEPGYLLCPECRQLAEEPATTQPSPNPASAAQTATEPAILTDPPTSARVVIWQNVEMTEPTKESTK